MTYDAAQAPVVLSMPADGFWDGPSMVEVAGVAEAKSALVAFTRVQLHGAAPRQRLDVPPCGTMTVCAVCTTCHSKQLAAAINVQHCPVAND